MIVSGKQLLGLALLCVLAVSPSDGDWDQDIWHELDGRQYLLRLQNKGTELTYYDAQAKCEEEQATLALVKTSAINSFLENLMAEKDVNHTWVGLRRTQAALKEETRAIRRENWYWADQSPLLPEDYNNWHGSEPNKDDQCLRIGRFVKNNELGPFYWHPKRCDKPFHSYICERGPVGCEAGWQAGGVDSCYFFKTDRSYTHDEASRICEEMDAHLVSIESAEEMALVLSLFPLNYGFIWLGLVRGSASNCEGEYDCFISDSAWSWPDGSNSKYRNWHSSLSAKYDASPQVFDSWPKTCATALTSGGVWVWTACNSSTHASEVSCERKATVTQVDAAETEQQMSSASSLTPPPTLIFALALLFLRWIGFVNEAW